MLLLSSKPCIVGKLFSIGCCICHHFEEHQTIHHRHTLHAMPLAQAITTVVAQPRTDACRLHCVEHFYCTTKSLTNVMAHMLHIALFKDLCQNVILDQTNLSCGCKAGWFEMFPRLCKVDRGCAAAWQVGFRWLSRP